MQIKGLQKLTLLDFPERTACTVFTGGCNFCCPFCHNASLVLRPAEVTGIHEEEFFRFLSKRQGILDGVAITGGEPLLQPDLPDFIQKIRALGFQIKLDTNGSFPGRLKTLVADGLVDYVAMDIKNSPIRYGETVGVKNFDLSPILESVEFLLSGTVDYEFRTTVVRELHSDEDFVRIGAWIGGAKRYFLQQFIDSGDLIQSGYSACSDAQMEQFRQIVARTVPSAQLRGT